MRLLLITLNEIPFNSLPHIRTKDNVDMDNNMVDNMGSTAVDVDSNMAGNSMDNMVLVLALDMGMGMGSGYMVVFHLQDLQTQHRQDHFAINVVLQN